METSLVSNPPYNIKWQAPPFANLQQRFYKYGTPPNSNANLAFVVSALDMIDGRAAFLLPCGVLNTSGEEKNVMAGIINDNVLDAVIALPRSMFESTDISTCILVFDKGKKTQTVEMIDMRQDFVEEIRDQNGQFGGSSHENRTYHKKVNVITDEGMKKALDCIAERKSIPEFSKSVSLAEIRSNDYNLTPGRYIEFRETEFIHRPYSDICEDINKTIREMNRVKLTVNESIAKSLGLYDTFQMMNKDYGLNETAKVVGCEIEKEAFITMSKNAGEFKIENRDKSQLPEMIQLFLNMWKQHIMFLNNQQNIYLAEFRDALLPDLMNGKIDLSKGEQL